MTAIIILNWNGWRDTLECLESLKKAQGEFRILVVDNGSTDESVSKINKYLHSDHTLPIELYETGQNYGFARGNNEGIRYIADTWNADSYLLLNNDTIVEPDFLTELENFNHYHPEYKVLTPVICYNMDRSKVWNCGGWQKFGLRKYYYADKDISSVKELNPMTGKPIVTHKDVTFLTGCALYFKKELLNKDNRILTENFFFGEEDFEFCMRMNQSNVKMACVMASKIYHKVNGSIQDRPKAGKTYIYYLNRFIDVRMKFPLYKYCVWEFFSVIYACLMLLREGYKLKITLGLLNKVIRISREKDNVTYEDFQEAINSSWN